MPQGSILGPSPFNFFVKDLVSEVEPKDLLFADDLKIVAEISSVEDCQCFQVGWVMVKQ